MTAIWFFVFFQPTHMAGRSVGPMSQAQCAWLSQSLQHDLTTRFHARGVVGQCKLKEDPS